MRYGAFTICFESEHAALQVGAGAAGDTEVCVDDVTITA